MRTFTHSAGAHLSIDSARIYFESTGNSNKANEAKGEPLVLLHGGLGSLVDFNPILNALPDQYHLIGIDLRGHGKSTLGSSQQLTYPQHQKDVMAVLDHLGVHQFSILGFSDGGITAYQIAIAHPTRVNKMITIGAHKKIDPASQTYARLGGMTVERYQKVLPEEAASYLNKNPEPNLEKLVTEVVHLWTNTSPNNYPNDMVQQITTPTLIVRGDNDHLMTLEDAVDLKKSLKNSSLLNVPFLGHEIRYDSPSVLMDGINHFLLSQF
jgi:pimeloyl-ACP methyl ester carboxylesterase